MDTIIRVILLVIAAWLAYSIVAGERRTRMWGAVTLIGVYLAVFGIVQLGLLTVWDWLSPKLTDTIADENDYLIGGLVVLAALVVFALDLLGKIDIMAQLQQSINKANTGRPASGDD